MCHDSSGDHLTLSLREGKGREVSWQQWCSSSSTFFNLFQLQVFIQHYIVQHYTSLWLCGLFQKCNNPPKQSFRKLSNSKLGITYKNQSYIIYRYIYRYKITFYDEINASVLNGWQWVDKSKPPELRARALLSEMTLEEKLVMLHGPEAPLPR